ncbi:metallophosphoesterase [Rhodocytophaga rosea]|uniref:Metallophosphoesterase n=1 Tax=Rhodocytophaga rosea TaxID=2704465 RepID=A0A6C0GKQ8_9BACT|nr:metallophosphoesterase [Rhodocytophaga rosea]QHT68220.1 metallophosphoesterase [Rhodocytophaga rosea]
MVTRLLVIFLILVLLAFMDWYIIQAMRQLTGSFSSGLRKGVTFVAWALTIGSLISVLIFLLTPAFQNTVLRSVLGIIIFSNLITKLFMTVFLFVDDIVRLGKWIVSFFTTESSPAIPNNQQPTTSNQNVIPRSEFLVKAAVVAGALPLVGIGYGIILGAHDYRVRRITVKLPNLPKSFDGIRIAQISDIHSGSFFNKRAVKGGVEMILKEKADVIFFTGDLVNNVATEVEDYIPVFEKLKAPLGIYSTLGNHDYGDYASWPSQQAKRQNLENLKQAHKLLGWDLLMNEHRMLKQGGEQLAIIGIENYGARGNFPKYGKLAPAYTGTQDAPVKLLLSHDPSHWDAQVRPEYPDIDIMFAGHTHGMQFGVEIGNIKWSPVQYMYEQWAGLYQKGKQYLYVNRGFGYIGFPGRIGMPPEITIMELKSV